MKSFLKITVFDFIVNRINVRILLFHLILCSSNLEAQDLKQNLSSLKQPQPYITESIWYEPISVPQSEIREPTVVPDSPLTVSTSTTFIVTTTDDTGTGSLRNAIITANAYTGPDRIEFKIPGNGVHTIKPLSMLPEITDPVVIDGTSQAGYSFLPLIEIDGSNAGSANGLQIAAGNSTIKGLIINRFSINGIFLWLNGGNTIEGSFIGTDATGTMDQGNGRGIAITSANNKIGNDEGATNIISGNDENGIVLYGLNAKGNRIVNNFIGTNVDGTKAIGNRFSGIYIQNSSFDTIGGALFPERNIISGNLQAGISIRGQYTKSILIEGNYVGTKSDGSTDLCNLNGIDIMPEGVVVGTPSYITIGGSAHGSMNLISGNTSMGIYIRQDSTGGVGNVIIGNLIGTNSSGNTAVPNKLGGIYVQKYSANNAGILIGGMSQDSANVISGNGKHGVWMRGSGAKNNFIRGNYIGTSKMSLSGITAIENQGAGIYLDNAPFNMIGGESSFASNVIGGNGAEGIAIIGDTATRNTILNNFIGTIPNDIINLGNHGNGVYIQASQTIVGGVNCGNIIARNKNRGIFVLSGKENTIRFNSIHDNDSLGIDLSPIRLTPNDRKDADIGANNLQNFPLLDSATLSLNSTHIKGRFDSEPNKEYKIDFYRNKTRNASHFGEGETYMGTINVQCDAAGRKDLDITLPAPVADNEFITATATDLLGNTSEFSRALCLQDSDGDGILDCWESKGDGIDVNADGIIDYNLWVKGARPDHKDIFVEVDWMAGYRPKDSAINMVFEAFRDVPNRFINNPDGNDGIHLVAEVSADSLRAYEWYPNPWNEFFRDKKIDFGTKEERESMDSVNIRDAKRLVYRYCVFGFNFDPEITSGISENKNGTSGNDFIVSLGKFKPRRGGTKDQQAGTFMHELGHTLGLYHGGLDEINYKPNYYSVMNYTWQYPNYDGSLSDLTWKLDYSQVALPTLNENSLNEAVGLDPHIEDYPNPIFVPFSAPGGNKRIGLLYPNVAVDWDANRDSIGLATKPVDINDLCEKPCPSPGEKLIGFADWPNLKYNFRNSPFFLDPSPAMLRSNTNNMDDYPQEMTLEIYEYLQSLPPYGILPSYRVPILSAYESDSILVGGNEGTLLIKIYEPAPPGSAIFQVVSSNPSLADVYTEARIYEGNKEGVFNIRTKGVSTDTVVTISVVNVDIPASIAITLKPANILSFVALADYGCMVTQEGESQKKYLSGCDILFEALLDGQSPPLGDSLHISSSRPDLIDLDTTVFFGGFKSNRFISAKTVRVGTPQELILTAIYRGGSRNDTLTLMPVPEPPYTLTDITQAESPNFVSDLSINNAGDVLINGTLVRNGSSIWIKSLPGFKLEVVRGMNDIGWYCGAVYDATLTDMRPAYWKPDTTILLPALDPLHPSGEAIAINNTGSVIGNLTTYPFSWDYKPVMWQNDKVVSLEGYIGYELRANALNDAGQVVGGGYFGTEFPYLNNYIGVRWDNGVPTPLFDPTGYNYINGVGIADNGTILFDGSGSFHFSDKYTAPGFIPPPPYNKMVLNDMNDNLEVVGAIERNEESEEPMYSGFIETNGYVYDLKCLVNFPSGWSNISAVGINNDGTILGMAIAEGQNRHFLLQRSELTGIGEYAESKKLPNGFRLLQNYPNPFNSSTMISYQLPVKSEVTLTVLDVLGREVTTLVNSVEGPGFKTVNWDAGNLVSGVYFYCLHAGNYFETKKLVLRR